MTSIYDFELIHDKASKGGVLLFHGLTGSPFEMKKYAKILHNDGYDVFCYSLPGHGEFCKDIQSIVWQDWTLFAQEKYNRLRYKYDDFFISGLCLGAVIALYLAENNHDISGVISLSTTLYLDGWTVPWYSFLFPLASNTILRYYYTFPEREPFGIKNPTIRKKIASLMTKNTVAMDNYPLSCLHELKRLSAVVRKDISSVICPILIIHSVEDDLTSTKSAKFVYNNVSSEKRELLELTDSYHLILYDNERDIVYNKSLEFLTSPIKKELSAIV